MKLEKGLKARSFEARTSFTVSSKEDWFEAQLPSIMLEETTEALNKIRLFNALHLFDRASVATERTTESMLTVVKGSQSEHIQPFLIPLPYLTSSSSPDKTENYTFGDLWQGQKQKDHEIEGLRTPRPDKKPWILNTTPFLGFARSTSPPASAIDTQKEVFLWYILENGSLNSKDPLYWDHERRHYQILKHPLPQNNTDTTYYRRYSSRNLKYPHHLNRFNEKPINKPVPNGRWITCPPVKPIYDKVVGRLTFPGCPQSSYYTS